MLFLKSTTVKMDSTFLKSIEGGEFIVASKQSWVAPTLSVN